MSDSSHSIPEPLLPEHQLLADAAPEIELSANFRSHVLAECSASHAMAQKILAAKVAAGILAAALAAAAVYVQWNTEPVSNPRLQPPAVTIEPEPFVPSISSGSLSTSSGELEIAPPQAVKVPETRPGTFTSENTGG